LGARTALIATILALGQPALALDPGKSLAESTVRIWRVRDGLPGAWVRALAQTPDGYLWIATAAGLGRLDGATVATVPAEGALTRLGDIIDLGGARDGTLWIMPSIGEPVCRHGRALEGCFTSGRLSASATGRPYTVQEDAAGTVWLAGKDGLFRSSGGQVTLVHRAAGLPFGRPNAVHADARGRLWVAAPTGLYAEEQGTFHLLAGPEGPLSMPVQSLFESGDGHLWAAAAGALIRVHVPSGAATIFPQGRPATRGGPVLEDRDGNVWIGGPRGLSRFRDGKFADFTTADGLPDDEVTALFEDREGSLWVGTRAGGLAQFTDRTLDTRAGPPALRGERIETVAEDAGGTLWVGSHAGLSRWRAGQERRFGVADGLPSNTVNAVLPAPDGSLWVATDRGLVRLRGERIEALVAVDSAVSALFLDRAGTLWAGTEDGAVKIAGDRAQPVPTQSDFEPGPIRSIVEDDRGVLWFASSGGLARLENGALARVRNLGGVNVRHVRALHRDGAGTLWMGTSHSGLVRLRDGKPRAFSEAEGLDADQLYQMLSDDRDFLWVGCSRGIMRLDKQALDEVARGTRRRVDPISFDTADTRRDISATRARQPGAWKTRDGRLWFATDQGIVTIDPKRVRLDTVPPGVWIEELVVDGRTVAREGAHRFPPGAGTLEVHFAGVALLEPHKVAHRYRLDGFDRQWVDAGTRRAAYYTNLAPGDYRFRVQARNADGVWNEAGDSVELHLAPHYYQTAWFYAGAALALLATVLLAHRARLRRVRAEYQVVLAERARLARELHDSLLQGMSAVSMQIYGLRKRLGPSSPPRPPRVIARELEAIEEVVTAGLEETRRFVWNLRERTADEDLPTTLGKLLARLTEHATPEHRLTVEGTPAPLPSAVETELLRITQEAVTNALKHAEARHIEVRLCYEESGVTLTVSDDGRGFEPEGAQGALTGHFGLTGMRERAARLGRLQLTSRPGHGTTVAVTVSAEMTRGDV
jgi:ligand-binding sensor domain-containing protein/signal transduction histidine kinase